MMPQQYCLRWKHHHSNVQRMFSQLLEKERFCDVTLYCSPSFASQVSTKDTVEQQSIRGVSLRAHRVVLAACSELLGALLGAHEAHGEPVLVIDGAEPRHLKALLNYMYTGEMNVHHSQLASLLKTAEELRIKGLTDIRWNNKDEPPDCEAGVVATPTTAPETSPPKVETQVPKQPSPKQQTSPKQQPSPRHAAPKQAPSTEPRPSKKENGNDTERHGEKFNVNGGPPPLIKLPLKEKTSPLKRERSDTDSPSPKRQRAVSGTEQTDDETHTSLRTDQDHEWQHGNLDITAERVVGWGMGEAEATESSRECSEDEWGDAPTDIGSFLHTKLRVDGDNSADEESNDSGAGPACRSTAASSSSSAAASTDLKLETSHGQVAHHPTKGAKSGPTDPRFSDVVKLSDYLQHGRRPQFWEENYVKRVMEAVRVKELEMKQAAEILGVSYGTLYGRYRDVYGCINRPYSNISALHLIANKVQSKMDVDGSDANIPSASRLANTTAKITRAVRDFWQAKSPSDVLDRLQRGDMSLDAAARALGVSIANLAAHVADFGHAATDFEPIPIEVDPSLKMRPRTYSSDAQVKPPKKSTPTSGGDKVSSRKLVIGRLIDEDPIPATVITMHEGKSFASPPVTTIAPATTTTTPSGKWPSIRVASIDTLRGGAGAGDSVTSPPPHTAPSAPTSPSQLMRTRPDLTIVAARKPDTKRDDDDT